jgi:hypothetical protein
VDEELKDLLDAMIGLTLSNIIATNTVCDGVGRETALMLDVQAAAAFRADRIRVGLHLQDWAKDIRSACDLPPLQD